MTNPRLTYGLSIDPNTKQSGLVYWRGPEAVKAMTLDSTNGDGVTPPALNMAWMLFEEVRAVPRLDWVAVEGIYVGPNAAVALTLARIVGCIELAAAMHGVRYYELSTREIDAACGLRYEAGKRKDATAYFALQNGHPEYNEHESDAFVAGIAALGKIKEEQWAAGKPG